MGKVLDIRDRLGKSSSGAQNSLFVNDLVASHEVLDLTARREAALTEDRRRIRRTILTEFIAVHTVIPGYGLMKVGLYNINNSGIAFDVEQKWGSFKADEEIAMRVYLNHQTYFPFVVKVKHITNVDDENVFRHGCEFVTGTINDVALQHFVGFIANVSAALRHDKGDVLVSNIDS